MAAFVGIVVGGFWLGQSGMLKHLKPKATKPSVEVGSYSFSYPDNWTEIAKASLPREPSSTATEGKVVAGVCPSGERRRDGKVACIPGVDVTYVLFQEGKQLAKLPELENSLDASLANAFQQFSKLSAHERTSTDGSRYLRYEFEFTHRGVRRSEILGAFRNDDGTGAIVVAVGPKDRFVKYRKQVDEMLRAVEQPGAGG